MSPDPRKDLQILRRVTETLSREPTLEQAMKAITDAALELLPGEHSSIRLLDAPSGVLAPLARSGSGIDRNPVVIPAREGIAGWVVANGRPTVVRDARQDDRFLHVAGRGFWITSMISEPLMWDGIAIGVLSVTSPRADVYTPEDAKLLRILASCASPRIQVKRMERLSVVDELTSAFNASHILARLCEEQERSRHSGSPLSVLAIDLDHLDRINLTFGHDLGDKVIEMFAGRVRGLSRRYDAFFRWGGDEFLVLLPGTSPTQAMSAGERLRSAMADTPMEPRAGGLLTLTLSIGVATWNGSETAEELLTRAGAGLLECKRLGGNRVARAAVRSIAQAD
jgi:diguanylate cyclase (GGDEF)-like protein